MATIEERANTIYPPREEKSFFDKRYNEENAERKNIYIKGATEQRKIDIEKVYHALENVLSKEILESVKNLMEDEQ